MPAGVVEQNGSVFLPSRTFLVKSSDKIAKKCGHDVSISVCLSQGKPDLTFGVKGRQQRYPRIDLLVGERACSISRNPNTSDEASTIEPAFVHVDDAST